MTEEFSLPIPESNKKTKSSQTCCISYHIYVYLDISVMRMVLLASSDLRSLFHYPVGEG